jgi:dTDP-4-amino-4,6-dideoxygalactose transaminase
MSGKRHIPFFDYPALFAELEHEVMGTVRDVFARGAYIMQSDLLDFERELASYVGAKHAIGVADGTMALLIPLLALDLKPRLTRSWRQRLRSTTLAANLYSLTAVATT